MDLFPQQALRQHRARLKRLFAGLALLLPLLFACSPKTTTPQSRLWQGFVTRYNTLYHAHEAYRESYDQLLSHTPDDYSRPLPLDPLAYTLEEGQERANFSRTLEKTRKAIAQHSMTRKPARKPGWRHDPKAVALQARTEYNPALADAWLLTAQALFYSGKLEEALLTAEGVIQRYATETTVREPARLWAVRSLTLLGRSDQAEELLRLLPQDASTAKLRGGYLYPATTAELLLAQGRYAEALPPLLLASQRAPDKRQRARLHFLLGQIYLQLHRPSEARTAFLRASSLADDPNLELAGRLQALRLQGETPQGRALLLRLGASRRYRAEQDQIFLALGQSLRQAGQVQAAEQAFQRAIDSARLKRGAWAEAQLELGDLALATDRYPEAHHHFAQASTTLAPHHPRHGRLDSLLPGLTLLAPVATSVRERDSLLHLALLPEAKRIHYIDSLIRKIRSGHSSYPVIDPTAGTFPPQTKGKTSASYFDDPQRVSEGKRAFLQLWGDRPLTDDWNRSQRPRTASLSSAEQSSPDSLVATSSEAPHAPDSLSRDFYLRGLPLSPEAQAKMRDELASALLKQAELLSEKLDLPAHAQRSYARLLRDFPTFTRREQALTQSLLLALREGDRPLADSVRAELLTTYPKHPLRPILAEADYPRAFREQARRPERHYASAWDAYQAGKLEQASRQLDSLRQLPLLPSDLSPKVDLLQLLLRPVEGKVLLADLQRLRASYPNSEVTPYVSQLIAGLEQGRTLHGLPFQPAPTEAPASPATQDSADSIPFLPAVAGQAPEVLLLYPRGSAPRHEVYFTLMDFIFTHFTQWTLEAQPLTGFSDWEGFRLSGFRTEAEVSTFLERVRQSGGLLADLPAKAEPLPLSPANLPLLTDATLPAYRRFLARPR